MHVTMGTNLKNRMLSERSQRQRPHTVGFHLQETSHIGKSVVTESRVVVTRGGGWCDCEWVTNPRIR